MRESKRVVGALVGLVCAVSLAGCSATLSRTVDDPSANPPQPEKIDVIAFASCAREDREQTIWTHVIAQQPDLFLFLGDNVYVDIPAVPDDAVDFREAYAQLAAQPGWQALTAAVPVLATWDDHDYGLNDAGAEFPLKHVAKDEFMRFFGIPDDAPMRDHEGIYQAHTFGPKGQRVQVILLDTRTFRSPLTRNPKGRPKGLGPYLPNAAGKGTLLGDAQWAWLEARLREPADLRVIASSIQVVAYEHRWECWGNFPHERQRLYDLIGQTQAGGALFLSGDRHLLEISADRTDAAPYPMWDFTSSDITRKKREINEPNKYRVGPVVRQANFGVVRIDWSAKPPTVGFEGRDIEGQLITEAAVSLSELRVQATE